MRGKKWVLSPHVVEVADQKSRANLFRVPGGYVLPVAFGGRQKNVGVALRGLARLPGQNGFRIEVIHPGESRWSALSATADSAAQMKLAVPLERGCAMVKLAYAWIEPKTAWFRTTANVEMGTTVARGEIRYTRDGAEPMAESPRYSVPVVLDKTATVRAAVFVAGQRVGDVVTSEFVRLPPVAATATRSPGQH
jgi:hypothetical protein